MWVIFSFLDPDPEPDPKHCWQVFFKEIVSVLVGLPKTLVGRLPVLGEHVQAAGGEAALVALLGGRLVGLGVPRQQVAPRRRVRALAAVQGHAAAVLAVRGVRCGFHRDLTQTLEGYDKINYLF